MYMCFPAGVGLHAWMSPSTHTPHIFRRVSVCVCVCVCVSLITVGRTVIGIILWIESTAPQGERRIRAERESV